MNLEQRLRESLVAPDPGAVFTARVMARITRGRARRGRRFIVIGAVLVAGLAAAMLALHLNPAPSQVAAVTNAPQPASVAAPVSSQESPLPLPVARTAGTDQPAIKPEKAQVVPGATATGLRVLLLPPRYDSNDKAARPAVDAFHSLLLQALRRMPDVEVEVSGAAPVDDKPANRVMVISPEVTVLSSGQRMYRSGSGNGGWSGGPSSGPPPWAVEVLVETANATSGKSAFMSANAFSIHLHVDVTGNPTRDGCGTSGIGVDMTGSGAINELISMCSSADKLAARLVAALRQKLNPPVTDTPQLALRLQDASMPAMDRQRTFSDLANKVRRGEIALDAATLDAITAYVGSLPPDQRAQSWLRLRGMKQPALIAPLLQSLQHDEDETVRLEALSTLIGDYGSDSRVLAALASVARQDASRFVRVAAQRPLSGDTQWNAYVADTLADKGLPATDRLGPLFWDMRSSSADAFDKMRAFMSSPIITARVVDIFRELQDSVRAAGPESRQSVQPQVNAMRNIMSLLSATNAPVALDLQIKLLDVPAPRSSPISAVVTQALITLVDKRADPRVSKLLDDIAAGQKGQDLRNQLEMQLVERQQMSALPPTGGQAGPAARPAAPGY